MDCEARTVQRGVRATAGSLALRPRLPSRWPAPAAPRVAGAPTPPLLLRRCACRVAASRDATPASALIEESLDHRAALCDSGLPDPDMCLIPEAEEEPPPHVPIAAEALSRGRWLVGLMAAQSLSSIILDRYSDLLREHLVITLFLTMLVGAGGNAGNQSSIKVIRGLATGALDTSDACIRATLAEQAAVGVLLGGALSAAGFARVFLTNGSLANSSAIGLSVLGIVSSSCLLGSGLPFMLARAGVDPANAGTSIQVVMDVLGVAITCATCDLVLGQLAGSMG
ncbi:magnesium transporter [Raphidocelis subcapitata]|uniref:Magnesium transporter n=1 Tax=Raphidocelis subcapitata TaxID=307507 RepID=A0A2V0NQZ0_9CHLO|nr:magnesium transporter [Raphidocelis subcapitata]|eukprot:GBF90066.1 magnesium transporter [Raphidocelis subcapitata]